MVGYVYIYIYVYLNIHRYRGFHRGCQRVLTNPLRRACWGRFDGTSAEETRPGKDDLGSKTR